MSTKTLWSQGARWQFVLSAGFVVTMAALLLAGRPARAALSINTSNPKDWVISNGALKLDWDSTSARVFGVYLNGVNLVDTTNPHPGLYMDNSGSIGGGTPSASYHQAGNSYIDWWYTAPAGSAKAFTLTQHFILTDNATGFSVYSVADHAASSPAGGLGQIQYVLRISQTLFNTTFSENSGLGNLGDDIRVLPNVSAATGHDPGRNVQDATLDLHGLSYSGYGRSFQTKYDYAGYEYLHKAHGVYGSTYGAWTVLPSAETLVGGPTKQDLLFTGNILMMECLSGHLVNGLRYAQPQGVDSSRLFGPYYFHFNRFDGASNTPAKLFQEAQAAAAGLSRVYDNETFLTASGYTPSARRGTVTPSIMGGGSPATDTAWAVLSDRGTNMQYSTHGKQYWTANNPSGNAPLYGVAPGTYRLSSYVLGQWGEMRYDGVTVAAGQATTLHGLRFVPENFGTAAPVWTIGKPDRSAHEFLHGHGQNSGPDDREYWGNWNFWADFAANKGAVVYNATGGPGYTATDSLNAWNYVQWGKFDPGLYAGVYNPSDDTNDGYRYIVPAYVGNPATAVCPAWTVHFTTSGAQLAQGKYAVLSVGLAATEGSLTASLNGHQLTLRAVNQSDAMVRSGLSGFYQWVAMQWDTTSLAPAGKDNVLSLSVNRNQGVMYDALRFELTNISADPGVRGWHDYHYLYGSTTVLANDSVPNP